MKYIFIFFLFLLVFSSLYAQSDGVFVYQNNKQIGFMSLNQFKILTSTANNYIKELDIEQNKKVKIQVLDKLYIAENPDVYEAHFKIQWLDKDGSIFKQIEMQSIIKISTHNQSLPEWRIYYRNAAEIITPLSIILNTILIIIILL